MEEQEIKQQEEVKQQQGWKDVIITEDFPIKALVEFLNILNQRVSALEDIVNINGKSITELYAEQYQADLQQHEKKEENK